MKIAFYSFCLLLGISMFLTSCEKEPIPVTDISLNETSIEVLEGESLILTATVTPDNATNKNVTWESSDESVATVNNGEITGIKEGTAIITASIDDVFAKCRITVKNYFKEAIVGAWLIKHQIFYDRENNQVIQELPSSDKSPYVNIFTESGKVVSVYGNYPEDTPSGYRKAAFQYNGIDYWFNNQYDSYYFDNNTLCIITDEYDLKVTEIIDIIKLTSEELIYSIDSYYYSGTNHEAETLYKVSYRRVSDEELLKEIYNHMPKL